MIEPTDFDYWVFRKVKKFIKPIINTLKELCEAFASIGRDSLVIGLFVYGFTFIVFFTILLQIIFSK